MIIISGQVLRPQDIANWQTEESLVPYINELLNSPVQFDYGSIAELMFEVRLRRHIVEAARELHGSGVKFATFAKTYGNTAYWSDAGRSLGAEVQNPRFKSDSGHY